MKIPAFIRPMAEEAVSKYAWTWAAIIASASLAILLAVQAYQIHQTMNPQP